MSTRIRSLNAQALTDEDVITMSWPARLVWAYLPCYADREGRLDDKPVSLKMAMLPNDAVNMDDLLSELAAKRFIARYQAEGRRFIEIRNWTRYQRPYPREPVSHRPQYSAELETPPRDHSDVMVAPSRPHAVVTSGPGPGPGPDPGRSPVRNEPLVQAPIPKAKAPEVRAKSGEPECPSWDPEVCWGVTKEIWESAGRWIDGPENLREARKKFDRSISSSNWPQFFQGLDWAVTNTLRAGDRRYLGVLCTFIDDEKWKDQNNPYLPEVDRASVALGKIDLSPPPEGETEW